MKGEAELARLIRDQTITPKMEQMIDALSNARRRNRILPEDIRTIWRAMCIAAKEG